MYSNNKDQEYFQKTKEMIAGDVSLDEIELLRDIIRYHEWKYYVQNNPVITDYEYDMLYKKLEALENSHPEAITPDSPTQRVSDDLTNDMPSVEHLTPMLSLANSYNADDLIEFDKQVKKLCELPADTKVEYCVEPKFDGGSIALVYEDDTLVRAATRGDGQKGEEMTANAKAIPSIPLKANFSSLGIKKVELRGEALIRKDVFEKINKARAALGEPLFANPRNAATGSLRMKDPNETRKRGLVAFIFQMGYAVDESGNDKLPFFKTHDERIMILGELGFLVPRDERKVVSGIEEAIDFCQYWENKRDDYAYEIDGMVVKVNDVNLQKKCGQTAHHPRWAMAYKFKAKQATTKLIDVVYQVGKTGTITPVAKLEPVQLSGVTVSSVSLHNEEFIKSKDLKIGDTVVVERAGDVIPYIVKSLPQLRTGVEKNIVFPEFCPVNSTDIPVKLEKVEDEAAWRCPQCICGEQMLQKIIFHVSKAAMDIDGFGKSYVEKFYQLGWIKDMADIYNLDYDSIAKLEGFGQKSAKNLRNAIEKAKKNPIHKLLHSLSIHHLGKKASKIIAQRINHVMDLRDWKQEDYLLIKDIGPVVAKNMVDFFSNPENIAMLNKMEQLGVNLYQTEEDQPTVISDDAPLAGKTILFTGSLKQMTRKQAQQLAEKNGAKNISAVSKNLDILVVGEKAGSKLKKAEKLGTVKIMTEDEFLHLLKDS